MMKLGGGTVDLTKDDQSGIATLILNNPERKNSFTGLFSHLLPFQTCLYSFCYTRINKLLEIKLVFGNILIVTILFEACCNNRNLNLAIAEGHTCQLWWLTGNCRAPGLVLAGLTEKMARLTVTKLQLKC